MSYTHLILVALSLILAVTPASADDPPAGPQTIADTAADEAEARAQQLLGTEAYTAGDHEAALEHFAAAYALMNASSARAAVSFDIGQSKRQLGDCKGALAAYREAVREGSKRIKEAAQPHIDTLAETCG